MKYYVVRIEHKDNAPEYTVIKVQEDSEDFFLKEYESQILVEGSSMLEVLLNLEEYKKKNQKRGSLN
jgi:hypothetical protein